MKSFISTLKLLTAVAVMGASGSAWSAVGVDMENPLGDSYYNMTHSPRIDMTNISLKYKNGLFKGASGTSTFTMVKPNFEEFSFSGKFTMNATISGAGVLGSNGVFEFTSNDSQFGFGNNCDNTGCKAKTGTVFAGKLTSVGWSENQGRLEFGIENFSGWACTMGWCTAAERLWFNTSGLPVSINNGTAWNVKANGTAVIPVPAAAWLLGSGLIGLAGVARRKAVK